MVVNQEAQMQYLNHLHGELRRHQKYMKQHEAPFRHYEGKPRHVREAPRSYDGKNLRELVVLNVGMSDCAWSNCRMCGLSTRAESLGEEGVLAQLDDITRLPQLDTADCFYLSPYSFFADNEMSQKVRQRVYQITREHSNVEYAVFMTRPNFISEVKLGELREALPDHKVIIWMGAETADENISKYCIDKGYNWTDVEKASQLMQKHEIKPGIWVLQKPPFIPEREGIDDAVKTTRKGLDNGYEIRLMPTEVMDQTITRLLFDMEKYKPPKLWSVIDVLEHFSPEEHLRIDVSGPHFERDWNEAVIPRTAHSSHIVEYPYNCGECNDEVFRAIIEYNQTKKTEQFDGLDCECKTDWQEEVGNSSPTLVNRIKDGTLADEFSDVIIHFLNERRMRK